MERYAANNSLSKVEYFISAADNFLLKKDRGSHEPLYSCCSTEPTQVEEASTAREREAEDLGCVRRVAETRVCLARTKAEKPSLGSRQMEKLRRREHQ